MSRRRGTRTLLAIVMTFSLAHCDCLSALAAQSSAAETKARRAPGIWSRIARILVGGGKAKPAGATEFPYVVHLPHYAVGTGCTGTLIHPHWVLTAAHCEDDADDFVIVGRANLKDTSVGWEVPVAGPWKTYGFDPYTRAHDIALVKLACRPPVAAVRIHGSASWQSTHSDLTLVGWDSGTKLMKGNVDLFPNAQGGPIFAPITVTANEFCTEAADVYARPGDSGGPGLIPTTGARELVGVMSAVATNPATGFQVNRHTLLYPYAAWITATAVNDPSIPKCP